jgi:hypothetical protein
MSETAREGSRTARQSFARRASPCATVGACVVAAIAIRRLSTRTGVTAREAITAVPGDDIIPDPTTVWNRGITIEASPSEIWPWLVQMGYGRGGFYSPEWFDRYVWRVPAANSNRLLPQFQNVAVGEVIADGPDYGAYWRVKIVEPERALVYWTRRHPWRGSPVDPTDAIALEKIERELLVGGMYLECSWGFYLTEIAPGRSRLVTRTRAVSAPGWLSLVPYGLADAYLSYVVLRNIKRRAEKVSHSTVQHIARLSSPMGPLNAVPKSISRSGPPSDTQAQGPMAVVQPSRADKAQIG